VKFSYNQEAVKNLKIEEPRFSTVWSLSTCPATGVRRRTIRRGTNACPTVKPSPNSYDDGDNGIAAVCDMCEHRYRATGR
jgi:hypothetical protein